MELLTRDEASAWVAHFFPDAIVTLRDARSPTAKWAQPLARSFEAETPWRTFGLIKNAWHWVGFDPNRPLVLWVTQTGVTPSGEQMYLYDLILRSCAGVPAPVREYPAGHLFHAHEREAAISLSFLAVIYGWDFVMLAQDSSRSFLVDHEGRALAASPLEGDLQTLGDLFTPR